MGAKILSATAVLLAGCGVPYWACSDRPSMCADGIPVFMDPALAPSFVSTTMEGRISNEIVASLAYWSIDRKAMDGWAILYEAGPFVRCGSADAVLGCWNPT